MCKQIYKVIIAYKALQINLNIVAWVIDNNCTNNRSIDPVIGL